MPTSYKVKFGFSLIAEKITTVFKCLSTIFNTVFSNHSSQIIKHRIDKTIELLLQKCPTLFSGVYP